MSALELFAPGVWRAEAPVRFLGLRLSATMTVVRLADGTLLVHSPIALTPPLRAAIDALGSVAHLYSPNTFHHLRMGEWSAAYPTAKVHAPRGLVVKRPDLRIDRLHGSAPEPAFAGVVDELAIGGFRLEETVLYLRPAKVLVVADLVHHIGTPLHWWTKTYSTLAGFYDRVAVSRVIRFTGFTQLGETRTSLERVFACPFERIIVGHGAPVVTDAREALARAYAWVPNAPAMLPAGRPSRGARFGGCG